MHYAKEKPSCSTFRVITANFQVSEILGVLRYSKYLKTSGHPNNLLQKVKPYLNVRLKISNVSLNKHFLKDNQL